MVYNEYMCVIANYQAGNYTVASTWRKRLILSVSSSKAGCSPSWTQLIVGNIQ